jgi:hypothetical protein
MEVIHTSIAVETLVVRRLLRVTALTDDADTLCLLLRGPDPFVFAIRHRSRSGSRGMGGEEVWVGRECRRRRPRLA